MTAYVLLGSSLVLLILFFRQQKLSEYRTFAEHRNGYLRCELRRRNSLVLLETDGFPRPTEERVQTWWLGGILLWVEHSSIGLPLETDQRIDRIAAEEFDRHFSPRFRIAKAMHQTHHRLAGH